MTKLVTLEVWAKRLTPSPHIKTVRRWRAAGNIVPVPQKYGRAYYVEESARYIDWSDPDAINVAARAIGESTETQRG